MKKMLLLAVTAAYIGLAGCNDAKTPQKAANDVADARQQAAQEVSDAKRDADKNVTEANKSLQEKSGDVAEANAKANYDVAMAKADGDHKVAIQQCTVKDGAMQKACKDQADAAYESAKADARATQLANKP